MVHSTRFAQLEFFAFSPNGDIGNQPCCDAHRAPSVVRCGGRPEGEPMRRRDFITAFAGVAAACPLASRAQQRAALPTIGFLSGSSSGTYQPCVTACKEGLK